MKDLFGFRRTNQGSWRGQLGRRPRRNISMRGAMRGGQVMGMLAASGRRSAFRRQTGEAIGGCTDPMAVNYNWNATFDDGTCSYLAGCTDYNAVNFDPQAEVDDNSCEFPIIDYGVLSQYQQEGVLSTNGAYVGGCLNVIATNYNPNVNYDDGSCVFVIGCTNPYSPNYNPDAMWDDGSCEVVIDSSSGGSTTGGGIIDSVFGTGKDPKRGKRFNNACGCGA